MSLIRVSTKKPITSKAPSQSVDVQYPCNWFINHPSSKPMLNIILVLRNLEASRQALRKGILDNDNNLDVAKTFLYYYVATIKSQLDDEWSSYGRIIGAKGQEITPLDLLQLKSKTKMVENTVISNVTPADDGWMAGFVLAIYRLIRASVPEYKQQIAGRLSIQLKALCNHAPEITKVTICSLPHMICTSISFLCNPCPT